MCLTNSFALASASAGAADKAIFIDSRRKEAEDYTVLSLILSFFGFFFLSCSL